MCMTCSKFINIFWQVDKTLFEFEKKYFSLKVNCEVSGSIFGKKNLICTTFKIDYKHILSFYGTIYNY